MTGDNFVSKPKQDWQLKEEEDALSRARLIPLCVTIIIIVMFILMFSCTKAQAQNIPCPAVDLNIIATIESSNNPLAYNERSGARGLYQLTAIAWKDVQNHFPELSTIPFSEAYKPQVARLFAERLITINKGYLRHFGLDLSLSNQLFCYNAGIGRVKQGIMPKETKNYILKYKELSNAKRS